MVSRHFDKNKIIEFWIVSSNDDYETMLAMYDSKRFSWSLFIGHLVIEKLLKAYYVKVKEKYPPYLHNLIRLANDSGIELSEHLKYQLTTITAFNLNSRYDDYKRSFQKKCTPDFTEKWIHTIQEIRTWMLELIRE